MRHYKNKTRDYPISLPLSLPLSRCLMLSFPQLTVDISRISESSRGGGRGQTMRLKATSADSHVMPREMNLHFFLFSPIPFSFFLSLLLSVLQQKDGCVPSFLLSLSLSLLSFILSFILSHIPPPPPQSIYFRLTGEHICHGKALRLVFANACIGSKI